MKLPTLTLLTLLPLIFSLPTSTLPTTIHAAGVIDIRGIYLLSEASGKEPSLCPSNITHTTWKRLTDGAIGLPHNTIIQDDDRCESTGDDRALRLYPGKAYDTDLNPLNGAEPLPEEFVRVMNISGFNRNARNGNEAAGEAYFMGYEAVTRVCNQNGRFFKGSTAFLMRPTKGDIMIKGLTSSPLVPGLKYLLMVPRFRQTYCLYVSDFDGPDDSRLPEATTEAVEATDEAEASEEDTPLGRPPVIGPGGITGSEIGQQTPMPELPAVLGVDDAEPSTAPVESNDENAEVGGSGDAAIDGGEPTCFPAEATVVLQDGRIKLMEELLVGDVVHVGNGKFSQVFAFTHRDKVARKEFVTLESVEGVVSATAGHFIYINDGVGDIENGVVGDVLKLGNGERTVVKGVKKEWKRGLYNPQTVDGDIVVDGFKVTTYTRAVEIGLAHAALAPVRALFKVAGVDALTGGVGLLREFWVGRS